MFANIYKKIIIDFAKITLLILAILIAFSLYQSKNFNLDAKKQLTDITKKVIKASGDNNLSDDLTLISIGK